MTSLQDLIRADKIQVGDKLVWSRKNGSGIHVAQVELKGHVKTQDGKIHKSPSSAAKSCNQGISVNGWRVWQVERLGQSLQQIRSENGGTYRRSRKPTPRVII